jgi:hypothetical protein
MRAARGGQERVAAVPLADGRRVLCVVHVVAVKHAAEELDLVVVTAVEDNGKDDTK